jgi:iron complex transport system permease protein
MTPLRWALLVALLALAVGLGLAVGAVALAPGEVLAALAGGGDAVTAQILREVRLPRVALAVVAGAALAMSGATLQGVLRNPLAEPYLLGVSGGAAVGAVLAVTLGLDGSWGVSAAAFAGAALAILLVLALARLAGGRFDPRLLVMAGVVIGAFANAAIMVALSGASPTAVRGALWWMMGSLADAAWGDVATLSLLLLAGGALLVAKARDIDALALGEDAAAGLGVSVERAAPRLFLGAALLAAATVAAAGLIGFVGLVVPALARSLGARRARPTLLAAALLGAALLVVADAAARTVRAPLELPVGAVTALVGVPFFLVRLGRLR